MRTLYDPNLLEWEVWAAAGAGGMPTPARIVFRCLTDPGLRPRAVDIPEGRAAAEARLASETQAGLTELLSRSEGIS